jgi:Tfp pilus assembly protein PilN|tara:strand:- start:447 stop:683 length:237 start_codon:yes stop_codon:yes gene_type:complete
MNESQMFDLLLLAIGIVAAMVGAVLYRVWAIPAMQQKIEILDEEQSKTRQHIHDMRNTLHEHDTRITVLEETKQETVS